MKIIKVISFFLCVAGVFYSCTVLNTNKLRLVGREFYSGDDSTRYDSFIFINDKMCIYKQEYKCDVSEPYRKVEIKCNYMLIDNYIYITADSVPEFLKGLPCFNIPEDELKKCAFVYSDTKEAPFVFDIKSGWSKVNSYGYIDNIADVNILFYHKNTIFYNKITPCFELGYTRYIGASFFETGKKKMSLKKRFDILKSQKVPINKQNECYPCPHPEVE